MMQRALGWARRSAGRTHPNPAVGAVVYRGQEVLGGGRTQPPGGAHAEVRAIAAATKKHGRRRLRGASLAVTLEPCCFQGRTGPCTQAIVDAGIRKVIVGCQDPHRRVSGRGIRRLRRAGIEVRVGVLEAAARAHHRGFFSLCERGRPFVTLKLATTLDGRIATAHGESQWITSAKARAFVHRLRAQVDAVMVGSGTALADDPALTARSGDRVVAAPMRLLVDSRLRVPATAKLYQDVGGAGTAVLCAASARGRRLVAQTGATLLDVPGHAGALDLVAGLEALGKLGLTTVLVEGGGGLAAALLRADLVDEIHWLLAPKLLGGDGLPALAGLGIERLADAPALQWKRVGRLGPDLHCVAERERAPRPTGPASKRRKAARRR